MAQLVMADPGSLIPNLSLFGTGFQQSQQSQQDIANKQVLAQLQQQQAQLGGAQQTALEQNQIIREQEAEFAAQDRVSDSDLKSKLVDLKKKAIGGDKEALKELSGLDPEAAKSVMALASFASEEERKEAVRENEVLTRSALNALSIKDPAQRRQFLERQKKQFAADGRDTSNIDRALSLDDKALEEMLTIQAREGKSISDLAKEQFPSAPTEEEKIKKTEGELKIEEQQLKIDERKQKTKQAELDAVAVIEDQISQIDSTLATIDRVRNHPGLDSAVGIASALPTIPGSDAANFEAQIETLQSQQFLSAVSQMKGMGALSENEGKKLSSSIGALNLSMSDDAMRAELDRIFDMTTKARAKMAGRVPSKEDSQDGHPQEGQTATNPQTGQTLVFRGGVWQAQ